MRYLDKYGNEFNNPIGAAASDAKIMYDETMWKLQCFCVGTMVTASIMHSFKSNMGRNDDEIL